MKTRISHAERRRRREAAEFVEAYQTFEVRARHDLYEMQPIEMLNGRWGTGLDEDLVVLEGSTRQTLMDQGVRFPIERATWIAIVEAHAGRCVYCGCVPERLHLDHIRALAMGGCTEPANLAPACESCNSSKGALPLSAWLRRRPDLSAIDIIERWENARRRGRILVEETS